MGLENEGIGLVLAVNVCKLVILSQLACEFIGCQPPARVDQTQGGHQGARYTLAFGQGPSCLELGTQN